MAGEDFNLSEVIKFGIDQAIDDIFTATPGTVLSYDPTTNIAVVKPMVKRALYAVDDEQRSYEELPNLASVPVVWPRAGGFAVTLPMQPGDSVLLIFSHSGLAEWRASGQLSEPADARKHSIGWPFAIPGAFPDSSPLSADPVDVAARTAGAVIGSIAGQGRIEFTSSAIKIGKLAIDHVALATPTQAGLTACMASANAAITAAAAMISTFNSHTHTVAATPGPTSPPVSAAAAGPAAGTTPGAVAAAITKAE